MELFEEIERDRKEEKRIILFAVSAEPKEKMMIEGPYRIIYHIKPDQIDVLAVIHGAMDVLRSSEEEDD